MIQAVEWRVKIEKRGDDRVIVLPKNLVLDGDEVLIRQDDWGDISIYATTEEGINALEKFGPFGNWTEDDFENAATADWSKIFAKNRGTNES